MQFKTDEVMVGTKEAIEILSKYIPENITPQSEEFEDKYGRAARRAIYHMAKAAPIKPRYHKRKKVTQDYWTCANCGRTVDVNDNYCSCCGTEIKWDSIRCLTGVKQP